jgi:hypothetical protein
MAVPLRHYRLPHIQRSQDRRQGGSNDIGQQTGSPSDYDQDGGTGYAVFARNVFRANRISPLVFRLLRQAHSAADLGDHGIDVDQRSTPLPCVGCRVPTDGRRDRTAFLDNHQIGT